MNKKTRLFITVLTLIISSVQSQDFNVDSTFIRYVNIENLPAQPQKKNEWKFIEDIKKPMWTHHDWKNYISGNQYVNLSSGVNLRADFPDPNKLLETAYEDLHNFFAAGNIDSKDGKYIIETVMIPGLEKETFLIEVGAKSCRVLATDIEGIRHGIFYIEDEMLRLGGAFLSLGTIKRQPIIRRRISRCFFAPIKRPGNLTGLMVGDELLDEFDYYPDQYLNQLAHEGVNGLWVTVSSKMGDGSSVGFGDLVSTSVTPNAETNGVKRLTKLQSVVKKCLRYGIRVYIKTMEPHVPSNAINESILKLHPDILGNNNRFLCASSDIGQQYLYEAVNNIFKAVPDLGGIINISHGELYTTCLSALPATGGGQIDCSRCSNLPPWKILYNSLAAMKQGMQDASPDAELISWLYMPQPQRQSLTDTLADWVYTIPAHTPEGVILQFNFESGVRKTVFGKELIGGDYWIATPGPSSRFEHIAEIAKENNTLVSAKIQTGTDYSVATVPYIPVPSLLYQKFAAMRRLGVSFTMLNWIVGASPGLMNKAAGILSYEPFPKDEDTFLFQLASIFWKEEDVSKVVKAWKYFSKGYQYYPLDNKFQYFGPMSDGVVWPLLLRPMDTPLYPTYQLGDRETGNPWPPSGDRIGECFPENLTFEEMIDLCRHMSSNWDHGVEIMNALKSNYKNNPERILDIGVANAIGIQFRSGYNILRFYYLRDKMFGMEDVKDRLVILKQLKDIIHEEISNDKQLIALCVQDSRLGFHADAEGYKYFPEKIQWRIHQLQRLLSKEMPELELLIRNKELLFPEYTGRKPTGPIAYATPTDCAMDGNSWFNNTQKYKWQLFEYGTNLKVSWAVSYDKRAMYIVMLDSTNVNKPNIGSPFSRINVRIQPQRLFPSKQFIFSLAAKNHNVESRVKKKYDSDNWYAVARISFEQIGLSSNDLHPIRLDVSVQMKNGEKAAWRPNDPYIHRLVLGRDNPSELGWLLFD